MDELDKLQQLQDNMTELLFLFGLVTNQNEDKDGV
jgi:hypothetical protein